MSHSSKTISIIGGGATGTLLAINLVRHAAKGNALEINLIEKDAEIGRGVAYGTDKDFHLLNVPAAKMGAFPDDIEHFYRWLVENNFDYAPASFVPRKIYGEYLRQIFAETVARQSKTVQVNVFRDEAVDLLPKNGASKILLASGEQIDSDQIVLAFGNFLPPNVRTASNAYAASPKYFQSPWRADIPAAIDRAENVLVIGTGLTAIDVVLSLFNNRHTGQIYALSTHGWLPSVHAPAAVYPSFESELETQNTVRGLLKIVRRHIKNAEAAGNNWRAVIDSLRPATQTLWLRLSVAEKQRFMRHLQRRWDVARHRMPPECFEILQNLQSRGQLQILRGRIRDIELTASGDFTVFYGADKQVAANRIINCTGSQANYEKLDAPLIKNLLARQIIAPDAFHLGLSSTPDGAVIDAHGRVSNRLFTLATAQKGVLWECTAMPDIRVQAERLALRLLENPQSKI